MKKLLLILPPGGLADEFIDLVSQDFEIIRTEDEKSGFDILYDKLDEISAVLVDYNLTKNTDYQIIKYMDSDKLFASIPVIAVSEHTAEQEDMDCLKAGFSEFLTPSGLHELIAIRINNAIRAKDSFTYSEMQKMLKQLPSNIYLKDAEGKYVFATQYWHHLHKEGEKYWTIRGKTDVDIRKDKANAIKAMETDKEMLRTGKGTNYIIEENDDGIREFLELVKRPVFDDDGNITGIIALINDVTEAQLMKRELEERSKTDKLTGLLNRGAVEELISMMLTNYHQENEICALLMIDVDKFKYINDTFGHVTGDRVLATIGRLIHNNFKGMDVAGRIGGDEFVVFLRNIESANMASCLADNLIEEVENAFGGDLAGKVGLSIGIAMYPEHGRRFEQLYQAADKALYQAKKDGRGQYHMYDGE